MKLKIPAIAFCITIISCCLLLPSFSSKQQQNTYNSQAIMNDMFASVTKIKTLRYEVKCAERIKGQMHYNESKVKLQVSPRKLYLSMKGTELLWIQGANNGDALVNPGRFPYIDLNLDPFGQLMHKDQHHTIHEIGLGYLTDIMKDEIRKSGNKVDQHFALLGEETFNNRTCYKISISEHDFSWEPYAVKGGENMITIARKLHVSEYMILEKNLQAAWYDNVKEGQVIQVPSAYAKFIVMLVDKELLLPLNFKVFDDKGLFETYEYYNLQVNTPIPPEEFTRDYKGYHF